MLKISKSCRQPAGSLVAHHHVKSFCRSVISYWKCACCWCWRALQLRQARVPRGKEVSPPPASPNEAPFPRPLHL